jgi:HD-GYP domain-containing protein (c-di-GMP phosphodiesterase class II)
MTVERALAIMSEGRETHFDPALLDVFFDSIVEVLLIRDGHVQEKQKKEQESLKHRRQRRRKMRGSTTAETTGEDGEQQHSMVG